MAKCFFWPHQADMPNIWKSGMGLIIFQGLPGQMPADFIDFDKVSEVPPWQVGNDPFSRVDDLEACSLEGVYRVGLWCLVRINPGFVAQGSIEKLDAEALALEFRPDVPTRDVAAYADISTISTLTFQLAANTAKNIINNQHLTE